MRESLIKFLLDKEIIECAYGDNEDLQKMAERAADLLIEAGWIETYPTDELGRWLEE